MKKRVLSLLLALALCLTLLPTAAFAEGENSGIGSSGTTIVEGGQTTAIGAPDEDSNPTNAGAAAEGNGQTADPAPTTEGDGYMVKGEATVQTVPESVSYIGADGAVQSCAEYTEITDSDNIQVDNNWYVVRKDVTIAGWMTVCGSPIHLILCDGATLTVNEPIQNWYDGTYELNVYLQSGGTGKLIAKYGMMLDDGGTINRVGTPMKLVGRDGQAASDLSDYFEISKCGHDGLTYDQKDAESHTGTCAYCGTELSGEHDFAWAYKDADTHTGTCKVCGYESTVEHQMRYTDNHDGLTHKSFCGDCDLTPVDKAHRFYNGKCVDCGALTCEEKSERSQEGGCIAHGKQAGYDYIWHIKNAGDLTKTIAGWTDIRYYTDPVITFLSDIELEETLEIRQCATHVFLDLDGHTISGKLDTPMIETNFGYGVATSEDGTHIPHCIAFQNGTIENTGSGAALQLSGGATTLENVDVKGDLALNYTFASSANYTATFLGGGSFTRICPVANDAGGKWSKRLETMLGEGCWFINSTNTRINAEQWFGSGDYSDISKLENVRVKACDHKDDNGNYTLFEDAEMRYGSRAKRCTVCGNLCPHDEITESQNPTCVVCGLPIVIKTTNRLSGKAIGPWYYTGLNDAMHEILHVNKGSRPTLELLADTESDSSYEWMTNDYDGIFIDLAGHTLKLTGNDNKASYWVTIQNTSNTHAEVRGTVNVYHKDSRSKLVILDTHNNLTIENVKFWDDGTAEFAGGSFGKITVPEGKLLASLLVSGYYFADSTSGKPAALYGEDGTALTELTNVTVKPCSHDEAICGPDSAWKCYCGQKTFVASVTTKDDTTTYYTDLQEAFKAADGGTVKLMKNEGGDVTVNTDQPFFVLDLNGYNIYKLTVNSKITLKDSAETKGRITEWLIASSGMTIGELLEDGYAFKKADGTWPSGAEQAVGNVSILPVPIKSVTAENPSVTVQYGETATLTATVVPSTEEDKTVGCQWYTGGGTRSPIEGENGSTYQLPADLNAGKHTFYLFATKDGYEKSCEFTVTVTPISIAGAEVAVTNPTYNGEKQTPAVTVTLGEKVLTKDTDYILTDAEQTDAGSYKLTVTGKGGYNGAIEQVDWKIEPKTVTNPSINVAPCVYDGHEKEPPVELKDGGKVIPKGEYTVEYSNNINAGNGSLTIQDVDGGNYVVSGSTTFPIEQASINTSNRWIEVHVFNELAKTYEVELQPNLDNILYEQRIDGEFGTITYSLDDDGASTYDDYYELGTAEIKDGKLILPIKNGSGVSSGSYIVILRLRVESTNFKSFELPIHIVARDKIVPRLSGTASATSITYGQTLSDSTLTVTGSMEAPSFDAPGIIQEIKGTFAWTDGTVRPEAGDYEAEWTFTPGEGYEEYAAATGTVTVKVDKAQLQDVSVLVPNTYYYTGEPQRAGVSAAGLGVCGERPAFTYSKTENGEYTSAVPEFTEAGTYTVYYKAEAANHITATGSFSVQIKPLPISLISVEKISKTYDGTASVMLSTDMLTFFSKAAGRSDIKLPDLALSFSDARFTMEQEDESYVDSPEVGGGKALSFTMTLKSGNYVFEREPEGTKTVSTVFATDADRFTITKADAPENIQPGTLNVVNGTEQSYTYDFKNLLPKLEDSQTYGTASYTLKLPFTLANGYTTSGEAELDGSVLTVPINAPDTTQTGKIGTLEIPVVTDNYKDFTLTLELYAVNKTKLTTDGLSCSPITYGDPLSKSTISGTMYAEGDAAKKPVSGTFAWVEPDALPTDGSEVYFTFTPNNINLYEIYDGGKLTIQVNRANISTGTNVSIPTYYYNGQPQTPSVSTISFGNKTLRVNQDYMVSASPETNVGTYATMKITGIGNYTGEISGLQWSIEPNPITPTIEVTGEYFYTGNVIIPTFTVTYGEEKTILPASEYTVSYGSNTDAGTGTVTVTTKGNYQFEPITGQFQIKKAKSTATAPTANDLTYNGTEQALVTAGKANGGTMVYSLSETGGYSNQIPAGKDAGSYTVYYKVVGDDNHNDTTVDSVSVTIQKAKVTVTAENKSSRVGQSLKELSFTCVPALFGEDAFTGALACKADKDKTGSYEITQGSLALSDNYVITFVKGTYTVEAKLAQNDFKFEANTKTVTYGDADFTFAAIDAAEGSTVTYSIQDENMAEVDNNGKVHILKAGETTITAMASETADYLEGMAEYTLKVEPKTLTSRDLEQTGGAITKVYDGTTKADGITVAVKAASLVGTDTLSITGSAAYNSANVDEASEILFTPDAITEGNYRLAATETLIISGASITQATPTYTVPTGLTAKYGQTLAGVALPSGWSWEDGSTSVGDVSTTAKTFKATFTPDDSVNYQTV